MHLIRHINFMDIFMLFWAILPFFALSLLSIPALQNLLNSLLFDILYVVLVASCLGFPLASILYFYWRGKPTSVNTEIR